MKVPKRVFILGRGKGFLDYEEFNALSTHDVWAVLSVIQMVHEGIDLVFDPHDIDKPTSAVKAVHKKIKKLKIPIFLQKVSPGLPTSMKYPLKEIVDEFGITYFTNTVCYMIAYAIYIGVEQIDLAGVNQVGKDEYINQKGGVEFWLGFAKGKGLKVGVHGMYSKVLKNKDKRLYGYDCRKDLYGVE